MIFLGCGMSMNWPAELELITIIFSGLDATAAALQVLGRENVRKNTINATST